MVPEHAPTPWSYTWTHPTRCAVRSTGWMSPGVIAVVHATTSDCDYDKGTARANVHFLCIAANFHDELIKTAEALLRFCPRGELQNKARELLDWIELASIVPGENR